MSDPKPTVYDAEPHTRAKHQILSEYLKRWLPILSNQSKLVSSRRRLLYVDGFAGAGEYTDKSPGSPIVAVQTALQHSLDFPVPIQIKCIEYRQDRCDHLARVLQAASASGLNKKQIIVDPPIKGDCEEVLNQMLDQYEAKGEELGPALIFLDQFGYSSFSINLVARILKHKMCEVFSYLNWNLLHPFMADETKHDGISKAFGGDEWKDVIARHGKDKEDRFREIYLGALRTRGGAKYAFPFAMRNTQDQIIYWLFFCSNNRAGLEQMKRAMWKVDGSGGFEFSDKHASQAGAMFTYDDASLIQDLSLHLDGRTMPLDDVEEFVLTRTPAVNYKTALGTMENQKLVKVVEAPIGRRRGAFSDMSLKLRFSRPETQTSMFS